MTKNISRRDFLKLAGVGAATTAVLTGCGPASRYVAREPYTKMPEYTYNGLSTYYATTCRECSAGCGLIVRTMQGRALKVEGNQNNPVNLGKTCARGQATLHGLYNPDRVTDPLQRSKRGGNATVKMDWDAAVQVLADALSKNQPGEIAFLIGMAPDHIFDLITDITKSIGAPGPIRYGALGMFEARTTLVQAAKEMFGQAVLPFFDIGGADLVFSFGANFLETWLSPVAQTRSFAKLRQGTPNRRGTFIQFEARMSQTGAKADQWIPLKPGTEALVVLAIGRIAAEARGVSLPAAFANVDVNNAAAAAELAVVLKKGGKHFSPEEAANHIGGYVIFNDITARDIQRREMKSGVFSFCKGIDTFCPLGPWIVTADEIPNPHNLKMELRVNGESRQHSHSSKMSVKIPEILSHYSPMGYSAGDVVSMPALARSACQKLLVQIGDAPSQG